MKPKIAEQQVTKNALIATLSICNPFNGLKAIILKIKKEDGNIRKQNNFLFKMKCPTHPKIVSNLKKKKKRDNTY